MFSRVDVADGEADHLSIFDNRIPLQNLLNSTLMTKGNLLSDCNLLVFLQAFDRQDNGRRQNCQCGNNIVFLVYADKFLQTFSPNRP